MLTRMRRSISCFLIVAIILMLSGCGTVAGKPADPTTEPTDAANGFYEITQSLVGGNEGAERVLRNFSYEVYEDSDEVILSFANKDGAYNAAVPVFESGYCDGVPRLCVKLQGVSQNEIFLDSDMTQGMSVMGAFIQPSADSSYSVLYLQLSDVADYQIVESENNLHIYFRNDETEREPVTRWYIAVDAMGSDMCYTSLESLGFAPSLCGDGSSIVVISGGYASREDAQNALSACVSDLEKILPGFNACIVEVADGMLPEVPVYEADAQQDAAIIMTEGGEQHADVMIHGGRFLAWNPDGERYVFARAELIPGVDSRADYVYEQLYIGGADGETAILPEMEFSSISNAAFSADGRYLAFLDYMDVRRSLMIYDMETNNLLDGEDVGFGYDTTTFVWHTSDNTLYGITGNGENLGIHAVTMDNGVMSGTWSYDAMSMDDSRLAFYDNSLYFTKTDGVSGITAIYGLDVENSAVMQIADGTRFRLDTATGNMAILKKDNAANEATTTQLKVMNLPTLSTWIVAEKSNIIDMCWDSSGDKLICQSFLNSGVEEKFQLGLMVYDNLEHTLTNCMETVSGSLMPSNTKDEVLMCVMETEEAVLQYVTYRIALR